MIELKINDKFRQVKNCMGEYLNFTKTIKSLPDERGNVLVETNKMVKLSASGIEIIDNSCTRELNIEFIEDRIKKGYWIKI